MLQSAMLLGPESNRSIRVRLYMDFMISSQLLIKCRFRHPGIARISANRDYVQYAPRLNPSRPSQAKRIKNRPAISSHKRSKSLPEEIMHALPPLKTRMRHIHDTVATNIRSAAPAAQAAFPAHRGANRRNVSADRRFWQRCGSSEPICPCQCYTHGRLAAFA